MLIDIKCVWKELRNLNLEDFEAVPIDNYCCIRSKRLESFSLEIQADIRRRLVDCDPDTTLAMHTHRNTKDGNSSNVQTQMQQPIIQKTNQRVGIKAVNKGVRRPLLDITNRGVKITSIDHTSAIISRTKEANILQELSRLQFGLLSCCKAKYKKLFLSTDADVAKIERITRGETKAWKEQRQFRITASRCYHVFTRRKNWEIFVSKYFWPSSFSTSATIHGKKWEPIAREVYTKQPESFVQQCGLIVCKDEPWFAFSVDGVVFKYNRIIKKLEIKLLEIKCPENLPDTEIETLETHCNTFLNVVSGTVNLKK